MIIYMYDCAVKISLVEFSDIYLYIEEFEEFTLLNLLHNQSKICKLRSWSRSDPNDISIINILHFLEQLVLVFFSYSLGWVCFVSWFNFSMSICFKRLQKYVWWSHETTATLAGWKRWLDSINFSKMQTLQTHMGMKHSQMKI